MKAFIVYCHPSEDSFTRCVRDAFIRGLTDAGHDHILSDLYKMGFKTDMTEEEYLRDAYYQTAPDPAGDVLAEQKRSTRRTRSCSSIRCSGRKRRPNWWDGSTGCGLMASRTAKGP